MEYFDNFYAALSMDNTEHIQLWISGLVRRFVCKKLACISVVLNSRRRT